MSNQNRFIGFTIIILGVTIILLPHSVQATEVNRAESSLQINFSNKKVERKKTVTSKDNQASTNKIEKQLAIIRKNAIERDKTESYLAGFFSSLAGTVFYSE